MTSIRTSVPTRIFIELVGADIYTGDLIERHTNTETGSTHLVQVKLLVELPENFFSFSEEFNEEPIEFSDYDDPLEVPSCYGCDVD